MVPVPNYVTIFAVVMAALAIPTANAELQPTYDLVGEDPAGDARNYAVAGGDVSGTFVATRNDILSLEVANDGDLVQFKLNIAALPAGTGGYQHAVHFTVDGGAFFVCANQQWTGGQAGATQQNTGGCTFAGETRVGPTTPGDALEYGEADGSFFIRWEVSKSSINDPSAENPVTMIFADTWFRGANPTANGCPASSQYRCTWNLADRAPDAGEWQYGMAPAAPALTLGLSVEPNATTMAPGAPAEFAAILAIAGNGSASAVLTLEGLPDGWDVVGLEENVSLSAENVSATVNFTVSAPADAANQTLNLTLNATSLEAGNVSVNITITLDTSLAPPVSTSVGAEGETAEASPTNETATPLDDEAAGIPGPSLVVLGASLGLVAVASRRRRHA